MRLCSDIDQTPASFLRHRKDWPQRRVVLMQSSESEEGILCHSRAPIVAVWRTFVWGIEGLGGRRRGGQEGSNPKELRGGTRSFPRLLHDVT